MMHAAVKLAETDIADTVAAADVYGRLKMLQSVSVLSAVVMCWLPSASCVNAETVKRQLEVGQDLLINTSNKRRIITLNEHSVDGRGAQSIHGSANLHSAAINAAADLDQSVLWLQRSAFSVIDRSANSSDQHYRL